MIGLNGIEVKEYIGEYEVAYSGTSIINNGEIFRIKIDVIEIQFDFSENNKTKPNIVNGNISEDIKVDGNTLTFVLKNIPIHGEIGTDNPFRLGKLRGKHLYITFDIRQRNNGLYLLRYTLLLKS